MQLSLFTDYSFRVLMFASSLRADDLGTVPVASEHLELSEHHVRKIVHELGRAGFLENRPGRGGGFRLAKPANKIKLANVLMATEGTLVPVECFSEDGGNCSLTPSCRLSRVIGEATQAFRAVLSNYTLADVMHPRLERALRVDA